MEWEYVRKIVTRACICSVQGYFLPKSIPSIWVGWFSSSVTLLLVADTSNTSNKWKREPSALDNPLQLKRIQNIFLFFFVYCCYCWQLYDFNINANATHWALTLLYFYSLFSLPLTLSLWNYISQTRCILLDGCCRARFLTIVPVNTYIELLPPNGSIHIKASKRKKNK